MDALPEWKVHELRAAALCEINELIPKDFYAKVATNGEKEIKDRELVRLLSSMQHRHQQLTPRQLAAIGLFDTVAGYADAENYLSQIARNPPADLLEAFKPESFRKAWLSYLRDAVNRYVQYLSEGDGRALASNLETTETPKTTNRAATPTLTERRIASIVDTARRLGYDPLKVATGGKKKIEGECLKNVKMFTQSTFNAAWKEASKTGLIEVENKEKYTKR